VTCTIARYPVHPIDVVRLGCASRVTSTGHGRRMPQSARITRLYVGSWHNPAVSGTGVARQGTVLLDRR
jgi:hypothetical protein